MIMSIFNANFMIFHPTINATAIIQIIIQKGMSNIKSNEEGIFIS